MSTYMRNSSTIVGFIQCSGGKLEEAEDFNVFSSFIACSNRNRSALAIFFTTDLQTMNYYSTITARADLFLKYDLA